MFLASPTITGDTNSIQAVGGNGGAANGTGGNFGGGGGGGGGIIGVLTGKSTYNSALFSVSGGTGGTSQWLSTIAPVGEANGTGTSTLFLSTLTIAPTSVFSTATVYILSLHITGSAGTVASAVSVTGGNCGTWSLIQDVPFSPASVLNTRRLQVWMGLATGIPPFSDDPRILVTFDVAPTTVRYIFDGVQNTQWVNGNYPLDQAIANTGTGTSASTTLLSAPLPTNMQYTVVARSGGTVPTATLPNTLLTQGLTPSMASQVGTGQITNTQTWTTSADFAVITMDLSASGTGESGIKGEDGKVVPFLV